MSRKKRNKGYTVLDTVPVDEQKHRTLPNSDPAKDGSFSYQEQPWQDRGDATSDDGQRRK